MNLFPDDEELGGERKWQSSLQQTKVANTQADFWRPLEFSPSFSGLVSQKQIWSRFQVMTNQAEDVNNIISSKGGLKYTGPEVDALKAVATAHSKRSLKDFEQALQDHQDQLKGDAIIEHHLAALYDTLLQQNLIRIIEPYSRVELEHVAKLINLPQPKVEAKLSQMILDHRFAGTLDQGSGVLIIFDDLPPDTIYPTALETIENMSKVVDSLYRKSAKIAA